MKFTKLLVMSALWLVGLSASAADFVTRTAPTNADIANVPEVPVEFKVGETYLLYNTSAQKFFTQGNTWGTRGCVGPKVSAVRIKVSEYMENGVWDGKTYEINDYVTPRTGNYSWYKMCMDDAGSIYTDQTTWGNRFYELVPQGGNTYRIMPNEKNEKHKSDGTKFLGRDDAVAQDFGNAWNQFTDDNERFPLSALITAEEGHHVDWQFFHAAVFDQYDKAVELKAAIEKAEAAGVNVDKWVAVYNNLDATVAELEAALAEVKAAIEDDLKNASGKNPKDASSAIVNGTFDTIGDFHGWSGTKFGAGGTTSTNAEWYQAAKGADGYQDVTGLLPGWYIAGAKGYYRAGGVDDAYKHFKAQDEQSKAVQFYVKAGENVVETNVPSPFQGAPTSSQGTDELSAKDSETGVTYFIPNTMRGAEVYMHKLGLYDNFVNVQVGDDGTLRIGVKKSGAMVSGDWAIFDDFTLTYVGANENDLWAGMAWIKLKNYPVYADAVVTKSILDAYLTVLKNDDERAAITNEAEMDAFIAKVDAAKAEVDENISLWKEYDAMVETGMATYNKVSSSTDDAVAYLGAYLVGPEDELAEYIELGWVNGNAPIVQKRRELTNDQLREELERLNDLIVAAKSVIPWGTEITELLANPDFSKAKEGWTGWGSASNNPGMPTTGGSPNICAEAYNANNFDLYQTVTDLGVGVYEVSVQAFTRIGRNDGSPHGKAWTDYQNTQGQAKMKVYIYLNDNTTNIKDVHEEPETKDFYSDTSIATIVNADGTFTGDIDWLDNNGYYSQYATNDSIFVPNTMTGAGYAFAKGKYVNSAFGAVVAKGDSLRLGVKGSTEANNWSIYDNFKMVFWGKQADKVYLALESAIADVEENQLKKNMTTDAKAAINAALAEAKASLNNEATDGEAMFNKLAALYHAKSLIIGAESQLDALAAAKDSLQQEWQNLTGDKYTNLLTGAKDLFTEVNRKLQTSDISEAEIAAYLTQLRAYLKDVQTLQKLVTAVDELDTAISDLDYEYDAMGEGWVALKDEMTLVHDVYARLTDGSMTVAEVEDLLKTIEQYKKNAAKYAELKQAIAELNDAITEFEAQGGAVDDAVFGKLNEFQADFADGVITLDQIPAKIQEIREIITNLSAPANIDLATDENPVDLTGMLKSPKFEKDGTNSTEGWTGGGNTGNDDTQKKALALEFWQTTFDLYQKLYGMPKGIYEVRAKAYYRFGGTDNDYDIWYTKERRDTANAYIYGMSLTDSVRSSVPLKLFSAGIGKTRYVEAEDPDSILWKQQSSFVLSEDNAKYGFAKGDTLWVPNSLYSGRYFLGLPENPYANSVFFRLADKGNMSIGIRQTESITNNWVVMDDFELWYYGPNSAKQPADDPSGISLVANDNMQVVRSEYFNLNGMRTLAPQKGIVIVRQTMANGNVVIKKMNLK